jgi:hypothetical protein
VAKARTLFFVKLAAFVEIVMRQWWGALVVKGVAADGNVLILQQVIITVSHFHLRDTKLFFLFNSFLVVLNETE